MILGHKPIYHMLGNFGVSSSPEQRLSLASKNLWTLDSPLPKFGGNIGFLWCIDIVFTLQYLHSNQMIR